MPINNYPCYFPENPDYVVLATHLTNCTRRPCEAYPLFVKSVQAARDSKNLRQGIDILKANLSEIVASLPENHPQIIVRSIRNVLQSPPRRFVGTGPTIWITCSWCRIPYGTNGYPKVNFIYSLTGKTLRCIYCPRNCQFCNAQIGHSLEFDNLPLDLLALLHTFCLPCSRQVLINCTPPPLSILALRKTIRRLRGE